MLNLFKSPRMTRLFAVVVTLLLLAALAYQCAQLLWRVLDDPPVVEVPAIPVNAKQQSDAAAPWLARVTFTAPAATDTAAAAQSQKPFTAAVQSTEITEKWLLKGVYAEDGDSIAIIQTETTGYVVEVGDKVESDYLVTAITPEQVTLRGNTQDITLNLLNRHLPQLAENTVGGGALGPRTPSADEALPANTPPLAAVAFKESDWLKHLFIKPMLDNGQAAFEIGVKNSAGERLLRRVGLQSGDIVLDIDGQLPSPQS
ncbi:MAG: hypothetical protein CSA53_08045, partial [Gammaproteobacteria bacterium]